MSPKVPVPHKCAQCSKQFSQRGNLTTHIRIVHEQRRDFNCSYCGKGFSVKTSMRNHVRSVHEQRRDYHCETCGKAFTEKGSLQRHIRGVHEKRRDFACPRCSKGFPDKSALRKHLRAVHNLSLTDESTGLGSTNPVVPVYRDANEGNAADIMLTLMGNGGAGESKAQSSPPPVLSTLQSLAAIVGAVAQVEKPFEAGPSGNVKFFPADAMPTPASQPTARVEQQGGMVVVRPLMTGGIPGGMQSLLAQEQQQMQAAIAAATAMPLGQMQGPRFVLPDSSYYSMPLGHDAGNNVPPLLAEALAVLNAKAAPHLSSMPQHPAPVMEQILQPPPTKRGRLE